MTPDAEPSSTAGPNQTSRAPAAAHPPLTYRPDIDGLRAVAIVSVVLFHAFPSLLRGGFVGVDVFFVISGYLISSIIFKGFDAGDFSFREFYRRRILRIFPALILVLASCFAVGWFVLLADELKLLGKHMAAGVGFVQNIVLYKEAGYFDTASETKPLLHLWSLGVEEQFYIFFPLAAWVLRRRRGWLLSMVVVLAAASLWAGMRELTRNPAAAFYLSPFRVWEILVGSLAAHFTVYRSEQALRLTAPGSWRPAMSGGGAALLVLSVVLIDRQKSFPGLWALLPVGGAVLLILAGPGAPINRHFLACRPMVWIGLTSYPLYLWHWPVMTGLRIVGADGLDIQQGLMAIAASVLLAWGTYRGVELPLRRARLKVPKVAVLLGLGTAVVGLGWLSFIRHGLPDRPGLPEALKARQAYARYFENAIPEWSYFIREAIPEKYRFECDFYDTERYRAGRHTDEPRPGIAQACFVPKTRTKLLVWGDSHAQQYVHGLSRTLPSSVSSLQVASSGCEANLPGQSPGKRKYCDRSNAFAWEVMARERPDVLLIAQAEQHDTANHFPDLAARAKALGVKAVVVVGPVPHYEPFLFQQVVRKHWAHTPRRTRDGLTRAPFETDAALKAKYASGAGGFDYLSAIDVFCDAEGCLTYLGEDRQTGLVTFDYGHLTPAASVFFAERALAPLIMKALAAAGGPAPAVVPTR